MTKEEAIAELDKRGPSNWRDDHAAMWVLEVLDAVGAFQSEELAAEIDEVSRKIIDTDGSSNTRHLALQLAAACRAGLVRKAGAR